MKIGLPILKSQIHIRKRSRLRYVEDKRQVPLVMVGGVCVSYWNSAVVRREQKNS